MIPFSSIKGGSTWILDSGAGNRLKEQKSPLSPAWLRCLVHTRPSTFIQSSSQQEVRPTFLPVKTSPAKRFRTSRRRWPGGGGRGSGRGGSQAGVIGSTPASLGRVREKQSAAFRDRREKLSSAFSGPTLKTGRRRRGGKKEPPRKRDESRSSALMSRRKERDAKGFSVPPHERSGNQSAPKT